MGEFKQIRQELEDEMVDILLKCNSQQTKEGFLIGCKTNHIAIIRDAFKKYFDEMESAYENGELRSGLKKWAKD